MSANFIHVVPAVGQLNWVVIGLDAAWAEIFPTLPMAIARAASQARIETSVGGRAIGVRSRDTQGYWMDESNERLPAIDEAQPPPFLPREPTLRTAA